MITHLIRFLQNFHHLIKSSHGIEYVDVSDMPSKANGYSVMGQIVLDKIGIKCYIFDTDSKEQRVAALKFGTVRFAGPDINQPGNICIERSQLQKGFY